MSEQESHTLTRDFLGIGTLGFALFALISMISYSPHDPSFNQFSSQGETIQNYGGLVGSYLADGLVRIFGTGAFAFPLVAVLVGWAVIRGQEFRRWPLVLFFGTIFLAALCALLALQFEHDPYFGKDILTGGLVGTHASQWLVLWLSVVGAHLILILTMFVAALAMSGVPADKLFQTTGLAFIMLFRWGLKSIRAVGTLIIQIITEFKEWLWETIRIWRSARREKVKYRRLSEPVIVSRELLSPSPKTLGEFPKTRKKEKEPEKKEEFAAQENFPFAQETGDYQVPPATLLNDPPGLRNVAKMREELMLNSTILEKKLSDFGVMGRIVQVLPGPVITLYEFEPAPGIKVSRILSLTDDLALAMRAPSVRILAPVPGKSVVGIELPNPKRETVSFKEIICSDSFQETHSKLALAMGKDHIGRPLTEDLAQVPHLLMAGSTGSGKSVGINTMICSLLLNATPEEVKLIMIDPKMLELNMYDGIPHLIAPVVTNPQKAAGALQWAVTEMERRYKLMAEKSVRNISGYNQMVEKLNRESGRKKKGKIKETLKRALLEESAEMIGEDSGIPKSEVEIPVKLPYIVIIIDELADLMMVACKGVEDSLTRLAQMARAAGIHLIVATQRPSVDVLTGIIKANFPARISYQMTSRVDSRTILDHIGAEKLLGKGDMLFLPPGTSKMQRIHGAMVSDEEINRILRFIKDQQKDPEYEEDVFGQVVEAARAEEDEEEFDEKYDDAVALVARERQASISMIQRKLRVGYNRAARMVEIMEREGVVGPSDGIKPRDVYVKPIPFETLD